MSLFWQYFRDTLAWPWLFTAGPLCVLAKGLALYLDDVRKDILWLRCQFIVSQADARLIPAYGTSRGIPRTRYDTDTKYRTRVERAYAWHMLSAKVEGLPQILAEYGYPNGKIGNCRDEKPELWAHFTLDLLTPPHEWGQADIDAVYDLAKQYKPARSVLDAVSFALRQAAPLQVGASQRAVVSFSHAVQHGSSAFPPVPLGLAAAPVAVITINHIVRQNFEEAEI